MPVSRAEVQYPATGADTGHAPAAWLVYNRLTLFPAPLHSIERTRR